MITEYTAVYQYGYVIFGVGITISEAIADAKEYTDNSDDWWSDISYNSHIVGEMTLIDISKAVFEYVQKNGGQVKIEEDIDGVYKLPEEIDKTDD
jgi:hypothetical protein